MRFISTFSGVEAASVAWGKLGWEPLMYSEVEPFACAVLANRFPNVPNYGDICKIDWREVHDRFGIVDVYIGGSPCQDFSIAGNRLGLLGDKSRLMYEYIRGIRELVEASGGASPRYVVFENVPGALSSGSKGAKGSDFGCLLRELDECGFSLGWRVLDAQFARVRDGSPGGFFGPVAQRRRRVFLVGVLGSPNAAEILFERSCLRGDNPPSREARKALAGDAAESPGAGYCKGFKFHQGSGAGNIGYGEVSPTLATDWHVPGVLTPWDVQSKRIMSVDGTCPTLPSGTGEGANVGEYGGQTACGYTEECSPTITAKHTPSVQAVDVRNLELKEDVSGTLQAKENGGYSLNYQNPVMLKVRCGSDTYEKPDGKVGTAGKGALMSEDVTFTIAASQDQTLIEPNEYVVRRLLPVETERLQGFEGGWTDLTGCDVDETTRKVAEALGYEEGSKEYKKLQRDVSKWSKDCPDTPRYKAMGNSIATPCLMWIGQRIEAFDILHYDEVGL